jgi:hypothetical protein
VLVIPEPVMYVDTFKYNSWSSIFCIVHAIFECPYLIQYFLSSNVHVYDSQYYWREMWWFFFPMKMYMMKKQTDLTPKSFKFVHANQSWRKYEWTANEHIYICQRTKLYMITEIPWYRAYFLDINQIQSRIGFKSLP